MPETQSALLAAILVVPAALFLLTLIAARGSRQVGPILNLLGALVVTLLALQIAGSALRGEVLIGWSGSVFELRADGLSALLVLVISFVSLAAAIYAFPYMRLQPLLDRVATNGPDTTTKRLAVFYALMQLFLGTMLWACLVNNIIFLYVAVEASTVASGLLVTFYWDRRSLEAGYKYLMLLTVGIAFALFGCVLLYASAAGHVPPGAGVHAMRISDLPALAASIPHGMALLAMTFFIVGFGTKAGLAPFHPWLPDAHAEAPSVVSALLSGVMIKMALYALARTLAIFLPVARYHPVAMFIIVLAAFTMLLGGIMCLAQDDLKRMLAYSSVSQVGYIALGGGLIGVGFGGTVSYLGGYGAVFHLLNHALAKAGLFLAVGAIIYTATGRRRMSELSGLARQMPVTAVCFFVAAFAISGMPPFNGFWSKLTLYFAAAKAELWWALGIAIVTSLLTLVAFIRAGYRVFWSDGKGEATEVEVRDAPAAMLVPMGVLAGLCIVIGIYPQSVYPLLNAATEALVRLI